MKFFFQLEEKFYRDTIGLKNFIMETAGNRGAKRVFSSHTPSFNSSLWILGKNIGSAFNLASQLKKGAWKSRKRVLG